MTCLSRPTSSPITRKTAPRKNPMIPMKPDTSVPPMAAPAAAAPAYSPPFSMVLATCDPVNMTPESGSRNAKIAEAINSLLHAFAGDGAITATTMPAIHSTKNAIAPKLPPLPGFVAPPTAITIAPSIAKIRPPIIPASIFMTSLWVFKIERADAALRPDFRMPNEQRLSAARRCLQTAKDSYAADKPCWTQRSHCRCLKNCADSLRPRLQASAP